jgi:multicomponent Na+:H+ antiporter subunit C
MIINFIGSFLLILLGLYIVLNNKEKIKLLVGMVLMNSGLSLLIVSIGYKENNVAGITSKVFIQSVNYVDPVIQILIAMLLIIGFCFLFVAAYIIGENKDKSTLIGFLKLLKIKRSSINLSIKKMRRLG